MGPESQGVRAAPQKAPEMELPEEKGSSFGFLELSR